MIITQSAGWSDIGRVRRKNEDSYLLNESIGLYVVADGMGGHRGGDMASQMAIEAIQQYMSNPSLQTLITGDAVNGDATNQNANHLIQSIRLANKKIYDRSVSDESYRGMGTTVSALYLSDDTIITANVGDSPIYLFRNQEIEKLYTPHTLLHERNKIPKSMAGRFSSAKLGHILTRAVGIRSSVNVDIVETPCFKDDIIVLCSDGLSNKINREEIRDLVCQNDIDDACKKMTDLANQRGGEDNITVIVVRIISANKGSKETLLSRIIDIPLRIASLFGGRKRF
jgi:PPM family protein phosphatase